MRTATPGIFGAVITVAIRAGRAQEYNKTQTQSERESLSDVRQLTHNFDRAGEAYFSKDMNWIIFQATPPGESQYQMYVAPVIWSTATDGLRSLDGIRTPVRISPEHTRNTCGFFSPDGESVLFASTAGKEDAAEPSSGYQREGHNYRWSYPRGMEIYRADGWVGAMAAAEPGKIVDLAKHALTENEAYDAEGSYSPDGKWIIFTSNRTGDLELFAMRPDGSGVVQLTHTPGYDGGPFFSPDGKRIVYRSDRTSSDLLQIYTADLRFDASGNIAGIANERALTHDENVNWGPFWHADGKHIIYATSKHGHTNYELYLMRSDGTHKTRITFADGADVLPVFSPDGKYLLWASKRNGQTTQVYIARFSFPRGS